MADFRDHLTDTTLMAMLRQWAVDRPEYKVYTFLTDGERAEVSLTYAELDRRARAIAAALQEGGTRTGQRVILFCPPGLDYVAAFFGCLYASAVAVPALPPRFNRSVPRLEAIVVDAEVTVALATKDVLENIKEGGSQAIALDKLRWLAVDNLPPGLETNWRQTIPAYDQLSILQYTSGSTGSPKGVMLSLNNLMHNLICIRRELDITSSDVGVCWLPSYHDMGLIGGILEPLFVGGQAVLMSPAAFLQRPIRWLQALSRYQGTIAAGPNFAYELCTNRVRPEQIEELDLSCWRIALCGAEPVRTETLDQFAVAFASCGFRKEIFYPCYGLAEATLLVSGRKNAPEPVTWIVGRSALAEGRVVEAQAVDTASQTLVSCGQVAADQQVVIVNPVTLTRCASDEVGEIWIAGPNVGQGYWNRSAETERTFRAYLAKSADDYAGPFLRTGDLGFLHDAQLFVAGRIKDLIIIRGRNLYPQDIELTVGRSHPALRPAAGAAFSVEAYNEERLVVVQELDRHARQLDSNEVITAICTAVATEHELLPYAVALLKFGSIPTTSSGKIQRYECRAAFLGGTLNVVKEWRQNLEDDLPLMVPRRAPVEVPAVSEQTQISEETNAHPLLGQRLRAAQLTFESNLNAHSPAYLDDYRVDGKAILPAAAYVEMALAAATQLPGSEPYSLTEFKMHQNLFLPESEVRTIQVMLSEITPGEEQFRLYSRTVSTDRSREQWTIHATGKIQQDSSAASFAVVGPAPDEIQIRCLEQISGRNFYFKLHDWGFQYGPAFRVIEWLWRRNGEALGQLHIPRTMEAELDSYQVHPVILDACSQILAATLPLTPMQHEGIFLMTGMGRVRVYARLASQLWGHARLWSRTKNDSNIADGDIRLLDESGRALVEITGLRLQRLKRNPQPGTKQNNAIPKAALLGETSALTRESLLAVEPQRRRQLLEAYLQGAIARVLEIDPADLDPQTSLRAMGLDSLLAVELKSHIEADLSTRLPMVSLFQEPTVFLLTSQLHDLLMAESHDANRRGKPGLDSEDSSEI